MFIGAEQAFLAADFTSVSCFFNNMMHPFHTAHLNIKIVLKSLPVICFKSKLALKREPKYSVHLLARSMYRKPKPINSYFKGHFTPAHPL